MDAPTELSSRETLVRAGIFIVLVLSVSWAFGAWVFAAPERLGLFNRVMVVPGLTALVMRICHREKPRELLAPLLTRVDLRSVAFAILYPLAVIAACAFLALALGLARLEATTPRILIPHITLFAVLVVMGEEYGWRGYLLPTLARWRGPLVATVVVGAVWAVWHAPFLFWLATHLGTAEPTTLCMVQMAAVLVIAFPFSHAFLRTGSVLPPMLLHYVWNEYNPKVLGNIYRNQAGLLSGDILLINGEGMLGVLIGALCALWFARSLRQATQHASSRGAA